MNLQNSALLLIDLQEDFFEHGYPRKTRTQLCNTINQLSKFFRNQELPVIWVRQEYLKDYSDAPPRLKQQENIITVKGERGSQILSELNVSPNDIQIVKKRFSAFFQTQLDSILQDLKVNTLIIAGANTHACVLSTVQDAYNRDYQLILVPEAVQSHDPFLHNQAWALMTRYMAQEVSLKQLEGSVSTQNHRTIDDLVSPELRDKGKKDQIVENQPGKSAHPNPHNPVKPSQTAHNNPDLLLKHTPPKNKDNSIVSAIDKAQTSSSQNHTIHSAGVEDAHTIYNLIYELSEFEKLAHAMKSSPDSIIKNMQRGLIHCLLCKVEGEIVGFALYFFNYSTFEGRPGLYLEDLYVKPQFRSQGLGKALLLKLMSIAKSMDCARMEWVVLDWNQSARDFYSSLGALEMTDWVLTRITDEAIEQCISRHSDETSQEPEESSIEE